MGVRTAEEVVPVAGSEEPVGVLIEPEVVLVDHAVSAGGSH
jgi:hypothetical protein